MVPLTLIYFTFIYLAPVGACDPNWSSREGHCYRLFTSQLTWQNAILTCRTNSATLVDIADQRENEFVHGIGILLNYRTFLYVNKASSHNPLGFYHCSNQIRISFQLINFLSRLKRLVLERWPIFI